MRVATFGKKVFEVTPKRIYTFNDLQIAAGINVEMQDVEGGKPSTYIKGKNAETIGFSVVLDAQFVNIQNEIEWWLKTLYSCKPQILTIGGKVQSDGKMLLTDVSQSDIAIGKKGAYLKAIISLSFTEYTRAGSKQEDESGGGSGSKKKKSNPSAAYDAEPIDGAEKVKSAQTTKLPPKTMGGYSPE